MIFMVLKTDAISIYRLDGAIHDNTDLTNELQIEARVRYD